VLKITERLLAFLENLLVGVAKMEKAFRCLKTDPELEEMMIEFKGWKEEIQEAHMMVLDLLAVHREKVASDQWLVMSYIVLSYASRSWGEVRDSRKGLYCLTLLDTSRSSSSRLHSKFR